MINHYELLEISENASTEVIKASYKTLVKKYHPDNCPDHSEAAIVKMTQINEAYQVLSDENKRKIYDYDLKQYREKQQAQERQKSSQGQKPPQEQKPSQGQKPSDEQKPSENRATDFRKDQRKEDSIRQEYETPPNRNYNNANPNNKSCLFTIIKFVITIFILVKIIQWGFGCMDSNKENENSSSDSNTEAVSPTYAATDITAAITKTPENKVIEKKSTKKKTAKRKTVDKEVEPIKIPNENKSNEQKKGNDEDPGVQIIYGE